MADRIQSSETKIKEATYKRDANFKETKEPSIATRCQYNNPANGKKSSRGTGK